MNYGIVRYIDHLTALGRVSFTVEMMRVDLQLSEKATERAIYRLRQRGLIASVARGYYLILTPEFRQQGCLPPDYFIDDLMQYWKQEYYVGLLSAALYHGAAHQQPQLFQVITTQYQRNVRCGKVFIEFSKKQSFKNVEIQKLKTHSGFMNVSSAAQTMIDLCLYMKRSGGLGHVATLLDELAEDVEPTDLRQILDESDMPFVAQRLGYILEHLGYIDLAEILFQYIKTKKISPMTLVSYYPKHRKKFDDKWMIDINAEMESDLSDPD